MRIGLLGGTFDPPHLGHLALAEAALEALELDEVVFIPAYRNPLKKGKKQASARARMEMVKLLIDGQPKMSMSDIEMARGGSSYAVDTLDQFHYVQPAEYWFLLGSDAALGLENWKQVNRLIRLCRLGVAIRPPAVAEEVLARLPEDVRKVVDIVPMPPMEVSATDLRLRFGSGMNVHGHVPANVLKYIQDHKLYEN